MDMADDRRSRPGHRRTSQRGMLRRSLVVGAACAAVIVFVLSIEGLSNSRSHRDEIQRDGIRAVAAITAVHQLGGEACALVDLEFSSGHRLVRVEGVELRPLTPTDRAGPVHIRYDPEQPSYVIQSGRTCGDPDGQWRFWLGAVVSSAVVAALISFLTWRALSSRRRRRASGSSAQQASP